uniref:Target of rapamycin complex 2 subunit MAPKAP1 n=2 Tax=Clastoptera arizonana TaxID=38151 RepID=A0A1B6BX00_9HEMI
MATYDNKHWLLSHCANSFIFSDDTGLCEVVMGGENIPRQIDVSKYERYPGVEESDEEDEMDVMAHSFDLHADLDFGRHRHRSNTAQRLQKMDEEKKRSSNVRHVKWEKCPLTLTDEERAELFKKKDLKKKTNSVTLDLPRKPRSLLTEQILKCPLLPQNPFQEYAKYDGNAQLGTPTRKYNIFLTMLSAEKRSYPMHVVVISTAKVLDLIGLICWKCTMEHADTVLKEGVDYYRLHIAEDDGEVDRDFPCLDTRETVAKFGFGVLALVERDPNDEPPEPPPQEVFPRQTPENIINKTKAQQQIDGDMQRMQGHMIAMEAPLYQSYTVYILNKVRTKTEVHLGISGEKVEIDPVVQQRVRSKFWVRPKASTYDMDNVVACDLTESKSNNRATFRLVYDKPTLSTSLDSSATSGTFKHHDFEASQTTATDIVKKINNILELRPSSRRKEYQIQREHKSHRRKSFIHLGPR